MSSVRQLSKQPCPKGGKHQVIKGKEVGTRRAIKQCTKCRMTWPPTTWKYPDV